jgi:predicted methyltransferase
MDSARTLRTLLSTIVFFAFVVSGGCAFISPAQVAAPPAQTRPTSEPYKGDLSIFEYKDRDQKLQIQRVMDLLGISAGKTVADVGAGSGWFTVRAAARVGADGVVYAEDINPDAIEYIKQRAVKEKLQNVRVLRGTPDDPQLPADSVDVVLMLKTYHEIAHPVLLLRNLTPSLKSGARIGVIDKNGDGTNHGIMPDVIEREMAQAGFKRVGKYDFTKADGQDYFLIFTHK